MDSETGQPVVERQSQHPQLELQPAEVHWLQPVRGSLHPGQQQIMEATSTTLTGPARLRENRPLELGGRQFRSLDACRHRKSGLSQEKQSHMTHPQWHSTTGATCCHPCK